MSCYSEGMGDFRYPDPETTVPVQGLRKEQNVKMTKNAF